MAKKSKVVRENHLMKKVEKYYIDCNGVEMDVIVSDFTDIKKDCN